MTQAAIQITDLCFSYGRKNVLGGVNLSVPAGSVFGFLGRNGSGKTTTIKLLLGLLKPSAGSCTVQKRDPAVDPMAVRRSVGYMAEDQQMYGWMRVGEIIKWVAGFYPGWDNKLVGELTDLLDLSLRTKVKALSKGQNSRLALLLALGHRPDVVILDDPTLGLDPIARKDFLRHVITLLQSNNVTVFFSSHLLYEIEPVADQVAILDHGVIIKTGKTDQLRESVRRFVFTPKPDATLDRLEGLLDVAHAADSVAVTIEDCDDAKRTAIREASTGSLQETALNLDEIFEAYVIGNRGTVEKRLALTADPAREASAND